MSQLYFNCCVILIPKRYSILLIKKVLLLEFSLDQFYFLLTKYDGKKKKTLLLFEEIYFDPLFVKGIIIHLKIKVLL
jgi:hypothetical protein